MISTPGCQATRSQQLLLEQLVRKNPNEIIVIHHITKDLPHVLQLEVERRCPLNGVSFERIVL